MNWMPWAKQEYFRLWRGALSDRDKEASEKDGLKQKKENGSVEIIPLFLGKTSENHLGIDMDTCSDAITVGGPDWDRTSDPVAASDVLSQLSYGPTKLRNPKVFNY